MEREELEEEVFKRLHIKYERDKPVIRDAIKMKLTEDLEDILMRMKEEGR